MPKEAAADRINTMKVLNLLLRFKIYRSEIIILHSYLYVNTLGQVICFYEVTSKKIGIEAQSAINRAHLKFTAYLI